MSQQLAAEALDESCEKLLLMAGASGIFTKFVLKYPESTPAKTVAFWIDSDLLNEDTAEAGKPFSGGYFFDCLWSGDVISAIGNAQRDNRDRLQELLS